MTEDINIIGFSVKSSIISQRYIIEAEFAPLEELRRLTRDEFQDLLRKRLNALGYYCMEVWDEQCSPKKEVT